MKDILTEKYILECLEKYCDLDEDLCDKSFYSKVVAPLEKEQPFKSNWEYAHGVSKGVLIFDDLDYVIKIPFYGEYCPSEDYYEKQKEYRKVDTDGFSYIEDSFWEDIDGDMQYYQVDSFGGAVIYKCSADFSGWDYCRVEEVQYQLAETAGIERFFAKTVCIGCINNWPIYKQERAVIFDDSDFSVKEKKTDEDYNKVQSLERQLDYYISDEWVIDFIEYWGEESYCKLIAFLTNWQISDLHSQNIGYVNGAPCLIDYSSFEG